MTLETILGKPEDNYRRPDFFNCIELKSHDQVSTGDVTLFTKAPDIPKDANSIIRQQYGSPDLDYPNVNDFYLPAKGTDRTFKNQQFRIKETPKSLVLVNDDKRRPINVAAWSKNKLNVAMSKKIKRNGALIIVNARKNHFDGYPRICYKYVSAYIIKKFTIDDFMDSMKDGDDKTIIDMRLGVFSPKSKLAGKKHDHGTGFRMSLKSILKHARFKKKIVF